MTISRAEILGKLQNTFPITEEELKPFAERFHNPYIFGRFDEYVDPQREVDDGLIDEEDLLQWIYNIASSVRVQVSDIFQISEEDFTAFIIDLREWFYRRIQEEKLNIQEASETGAFFVKYQPVRQIDRGRVNGTIFVEVLGRRADHTSFSPIRMFQILKTLNRLDRYTQTIVPMVLRDLQEHEDKKLPVSFNVTREDLKYKQEDGKDFCDVMLSQLMCHGIAPNRVVIELLEWSIGIMKDPACIEMIRKMQDKGFRFAIDDVSREDDINNIFHLANQGIILDIIKIDYTVTKKYAKGSEEEKLAAEQLLYIVSSACMRIVGATNITPAIIIEGIEDEQTLSSILSLHRKLCESGFPGFHGLQGYHFDLPNEKLAAVA